MMIKLGITTFKDRLIKILMVVLIDNKIIVEKGYNYMIVKKLIKGYSVFLLLYFIIDICIKYSSYKLLHGDYMTWYNNVVRIK